MINVIYRFKCDRCGHTIEHKYPYRIGDTPPKPQLPVRWREVKHQTICDSHLVEVNIIDP